MSQAASPSAWGSTDTAQQPVHGEVRESADRVPWTGRERGVLAGIVLFAAVMYGWEAAHAEYHGFYAVAVRSMTTGWRAFLFGALDPNASHHHRQDPRLPVAAGAERPGLRLPPVVAGAAPGRRGRGDRARAAPRRAPLARRRTPGCWPPAIFALTPVAASLFGKVLEDAALTCLLVLAAAAWQRAVLDRADALAAAVRSLGRAGLPGQDAPVLGRAPGLRRGLPARRAAALAHQAVADAGRGSRAAWRSRCPGWSSPP